MKILKDLLTEIAQSSFKPNELHRDTVSDTETEAREKLLEDFESALHYLVGKAQKEADEIGGYFRAPGIRAQITEILMKKLRGLK